MNIDKIKIDDDRQGIELSVEQEKFFRILIDKKLKVYNNHIVFEISIIDKTIRIADFSTINNTIHWFDILKNKHKDYFIERKQGCVYESALNVQNLKKRMKRDYGLNIYNFKFSKEKSNAGVLGTIDIFKYD